jgi:Fe-S-cluster-containing hydrogenase component 2
VPVCPHHALIRYSDGRVELIEPRCTGCGKCIAACPFDAIRRVTALDIAVKCDGCAAIGGSPACVPACPTGALWPELR